MAKQRRTRGICKQVAEAQVALAEAPIQERRS
jgi:hypothetical protein